MNYKQNCLICDGNNWDVTGKREQRESDNRWLYGYPKIQKPVFFEIWHPNKSFIHMKRCVCKRCGFVLDIPRPDEKELDKKYEYLAAKEKNLGAAKNISKRAMENEYTQAKDILSLAVSNLDHDRKIFDILDYGGGDGHILKPMKKMNHNCYLVDYNIYPMNGIEHIGRVLSDIPKRNKFDLIICRHVLEHVANPQKIISGFKDYLKDGGIVYAEVPIQLFGAKKPSKDPVTHINFFQNESFRILFENAGFKTIMARRKITKYHGEPTTVAQILGKEAKRTQDILYSNSYEYTISLMNSSLFKLLIISLKNPLHFLKKIYMKFTRLIKLFLSNI